jgi:integrase
MRHDQITDGWWEMPGKPDPNTGWPGTKNGAIHRVWLPQPVRDIIVGLNYGDDFVFGGSRQTLGAAMRAICGRLGAERVTPHDLRRTLGSTITKLGFGREAMNRIQNHKEGGIGDVYDRHEYSDENRRVMECTAMHLLALGQGDGGAKILVGAFTKPNTMA